MQILDFQACWLLHSSCACFCPDCLHMNLYKSYREYSHNQRKSATAGAVKLPCKSILLEHFLGMESGFLWSGESCTLAVICRPTIVLMALETHEMLAKWMDELRANWTGQGEMMMRRLWMKFTHSILINFRRAPLCRANHRFSSGWVQNTARSRAAVASKSHLLLDQSNTAQADGRLADGPLAQVRLARPGTVRLRGWLQM